MAASSSASTLDRLEGLKLHCSHWSLETDRQLLEALHGMSSSLLASLRDCQIVINSLARQADDAAVSVTAATSQFRLLSHKRLIQQVPQVSWCQTL